MFPYSKYVHIGGDEAYAMPEWTKCAGCQAYAKSVGIDTDMEDKKITSLKNKEVIFLLNDYFFAAFLVVVCFFSAILTHPFNYNVGRIFSTSE